MTYWLSSSQSFHRLPDTADEHVSRTFYFQGRLVHLDFLVVMLIHILANKSFFFFFFFYFKAKYVSRTSVQADYISRNTTAQTRIKPENI